MDFFPGIFQTKYLPFNDRLQLAFPESTLSPQSGTMNLASGKHREDISFGKWNKESQILHNTVDRIDLRCITELSMRADSFSWEPV